MIGFVYWGASLLVVAQFAFVLNDLFLVLQAKTKTGKKVQAALQRQQEEAVEAATHEIRAQRDAVRQFWALTTRLLKNLSYGDQD